MKLSEKLYCAFMVCGFVVMLWLALESYTAGALAMLYSLVVVSAAYEIMSERDDWKHYERDDG